jgi:hypothetical protein
MRLPVLAAVLTLLVAAPASAGVPLIDYSLQGTTGDNGWYVSNVTIVWSINWNGSTPVSSTCPAAQLVQQDTPPVGAAQTCSATNAAGTSSASTTPLHIDRTKPTVTGAALGRTADHNGWFNHPVGVTWSGSDASSGVASCSSYTYAGPDSAAASPAGTCRDVAGNVSAPAPTTFKYDATPPDVTGANPDRGPDSHGWYVRPLTLAFFATDATSGVDSCDTVTYQGPDRPDPFGVNGGCRDKAGNTGIEPFPIAYDADPPTLTRLSAVGGDTVASLSWRASSDTRTIRIIRRPGPKKPIFQGKAQKFGDRRLRNGVRYRYIVTAIDGPGHRTTETIRARPTAWLLTPSPGAHRKAPPWLRWKRVKHATYYNIQLYRGKTKILSAWPSGPRLKLQSAWRYAGKWHRLAPGTYRWYMWPAYGNPSQRRYGRLRGARMFKMI